MDARDPLSDLLSSLEQAGLQQDAWRDEPEAPDAFCEFQALRSQAGLEDDDFARMMGVSLATVKEWNAHRVKPSGAELKLLKLLLDTPKPPAPL